MSNAQTTYENLVAKQRETATLGSCMSVLSWDRETNMPSAGAAHRAEQTALLAGLVHARTTAPEIGDLLSTCEASDSLMGDPLSVEAVNVREWRHAYDKQTKLPQDLVVTFARTTSLAHQDWVAARAASDFGLFAASLEKIIHLVREKAQAYGFSETLYDGLLDDYEPGETTAHVTRLFSELRRELVPLIAAVKDAPQPPDADILARSYPAARQKLLAQSAVSQCGYDFAWGRLDETVHPFCTTLGPGDVRITTRYNPKFFNESFFGSLHEMGHALYATGLDSKQFGAPMGDAVGLAIHESQSRMWENFVGRNQHYWQFMFPQVRGVFPHTLGDVDGDDFYRAVNHIAPSLIRVEADEATYNLHVILRFELEQALVSGDLAVRDVPEAWNTKMQELLGLDVPDTARGCLQDIHWSMGALGYFSTYALGNLYAAQFFAQAQEDIPDLEAGFAHGEFLSLLTWLRDNIHQQGKRRRGAALVEKITGKPLSIAPLMKHLRRKIKRVYGISA